MPSLAPFTPGQSIVATVAVASAAIALPATHGQQIMVTSPASNNIAYIAFGATAPTVVIPTGTATNGVPILPGTTRVFTVPLGALYVATIGTAGNTLIFTGGDGQ